MDVEATLSNDYNRRSINLQIDTNEPGRIIGYHGKVLKALPDYWLKIIFTTAIQEPSTLLLMSMIMLNTVQKSCRPMRKNWRLVF